MELDKLLVLTLVLPFLGAVISSRLSGRDSDGCAVFFALTTLVASIISVLRAPAKFVKLVWGLPWITDKKLFGIMIDSLSGVMLLVIAIIGFLVILYSTEYMGPGNKEHPIRNEKGRYYFWILFFKGSMIGVALAPNLLQMFLFWEMTTICSWALISFYGHKKGVESGFKALIMTHIGGIMFIIAMVVLFVGTGTFDFSAIANSYFKNAIFILLILSAMTKASQFPLYTWLPDAMEAPTTVSCYLHAAAMVKAGVYLSLRLTSSLWGELGHGVGITVAVLAVITMLLAVFYFVLQDDLKRLLAFSTIAQLSYIFLASALGILGADIGFKGGVVHIMCHGFAKGLLFLTAGAIAYSTGSKKISELTGLSSRLPLATLAFIVGFAALTGIPPFSCFFSKFMLIMGALQIGGWTGGLILTAFVVEVVIAFLWFVIIAHKILFGKESTKAEVAGEVKAPMLLSLIVMMIFCLAAPFIVMPMVEGV